MSIQLRTGKGNPKRKSYRNYIGGVTVTVTQENKRLEQAYEMKER